MKDYIDAILNSGYQGAFVITGGGMSCLHELTKYGGASKMLLHAVFPYSKSCLDSVMTSVYWDETENPLTNEVECGFVEPYEEEADEYKAVSLKTAGRLSSVAYSNAVFFCDEEHDRDSKIFGFGFTAKLTYPGEREGRKHEACWCIKFSDDFYSGKFVVEGETREEQEKQCAEEIIQVLAENLGED